MEEKRLSRVMPPEHRVKVGLTWHGHHGVGGELIDLSVRGAQVVLSLPSSEVPPLPVGTGVFLSFKVHDRPRTSSMLALVRYERAMNDDRILALEISDWRSFATTLPFELFAWFNRRRNERVALPAEPPLIATIKHGRAVDSAQLLNICANGCLLVLPSIRPDVGKKLAVAFRLPDSSYKYRLTGQIRNVSDRPGPRYCGVEFLYSRTADAAVQQQGISLYALMRKREIAES